MDSLELLSFTGARPLFATLRAYPRRQFSINELAKTAHLPFTTTWKLVQKFERANLLSTTLIGKSRAVNYTDTPYSRRITKIIALSTSPQALSLPELKRVLNANKRIRAAYLFGSTAKGTEKLESDIDLAVLTRDQNEIHLLIETMRNRYGVKLMPLAFETKTELDDFLKDKQPVKIK